MIEKKKRCSSNGFLKQLTALELLLKKYSEKFTVRMQMLETKQYNLVRGVMVTFYKSIKVSSVLL